MPTRGKNVEEKRISNAAKQARWRKRQRQPKSAEPDPGPLRPDPAAENDSDDQLDLSAIGVALPSIANHLLSFFTASSQCSQRCIYSYPYTATEIGLTQSIPAL